MRRIALILLLIFCAVAWSQTPPLAKGKAGRNDQSQGAHGASQENPKAHGVAPGTQGAEHNPVNSSNPEKEGDRATLSKKAQTPIIDWGVFWTGVAAVAALVVMCINGYQAKLTRDSLELTRKAIEDAKTSGAESLAATQQQLTLSKRFADAATKSAETAERSLVLTERPWITFGYPEVKFVNGFAVGKAIQPTVKNAGRSPAILKSVGAKIYRGNTSPTPLRAARELLKNRMDGILTPGETVGVTTLAVNYVAGQEEKVYLVMTAKYRDIFGGRHHSMCIWKMDLSGNFFVQISEPGFHYYTSQRPASTNTGPPFPGEPSMCCPYQVLSGSETGLIGVVTQELRSQDRGRHFLPVFGDFYFYASFLGEGAVKHAVDR